MLHAYLNYPDARISAHRDPGCWTIARTPKTPRRIVRLDADSLAEELRKFEAKAYVFASYIEANDMWLVIDLGDEESEAAALDQVHRIVSRHYTRFRRAVVRWHC